MGDGGLRWIIFVLFTFSFFFAMVEDQEAPKSPGSSHPIELGKVQWHRGFEGAIERALREDKTLLVLFQEVPG